MCCHSNTSLGSRNLLVFLFNFQKDRQENGSEETFQHSCNLQNAVILVAHDDHYGVKFTFLTPFERKEIGDVNFQLEKE